MKTKTMFAIVWFLFGPLGVENVHKMVKFLYGKVNSILGGVRLRIRCSNAIDRKVKDVRLSLESKRKLTSFPDYSPEGGL